MTRTDADDHVRLPDGGSDPLVSVLMATYERAEIMPRAVRSVLAQEYDPLELLVVDDCSSDDTPEVVKGMDDDRITYVRHDRNRGFAAAINTAAANATGEYYAIIGDDDIWVDELKLSKQIAAARSTESVGVVCTGFRVLDHKGNVSDVVQPTEPANLERRILKHNGIISSTTALVPRTVWEEHDGFDESVPRGIDSDFFRRLIFDGYEVIFLQDVTTEVAAGRDDRMTAKTTVDRIRPHIKADRSKLERFAEQYDRYPTSRGAVRRNIGINYLKMWRLSGDRDHAVQARRAFRRSLSDDPASIVGIGGFVVSAGLGVVGGVVPVEKLGPES